MENITRGTNRPAESIGLEIQPQAQPKPSISITLRMSSIPITVTREGLCRILEGLATFHSFHIDEAKHPRGSNIRSFSLAPSPSSFDSDKYQVATVTFCEIPTELVGCVSTTDTLIVWFKMEDEEIEVDVNSHFRGLTPLNYAPNPSLEYVVRSIPLILLASHFTVRVPDTILFSIIAVTGLAGHAFGSWRSRKTGKMWLRDILPTDLPHARIMTYGYDTKLTGSKCNARISDYAREFLATIIDARREDPHRPIIFIGHSLGGLLIKEVRMINLLSGPPRRAKLLLGSHPR